METRDIRINAQSDLSVADLAWLEVEVEKVEEVTT